MGGMGPFGMNGMGPGMGMGNMFGMGMNGLTAASQPRLYHSVGLGAGFPWLCRKLRGWVLVRLANSGRTTSVFFILSPASEECHPLVCNLATLWQGR